MSKVISQRGKTGTVSIGSSQTRYEPFGNGDIGFTISTEAQAKVAVRHPGVWSNLYARVSSSTTVGTVTVRTRKNTANGNQSLSIGAGATGEFEDTTNTDSVSSGDLCDYSFVNSSTGNCFFGFVASLYETTNTTICVDYYAPRTNAMFVNAAQTKYGMFTAGNNSTKSNVDIEWSFSTVFERYGAYISSNTATTTTTMGMAINAGVGNLLISIPTTSTGLFEDAANSDSISSGDDVAFYMSRGAGGSGSSTSQTVYVASNTSSGKALFTWGVAAGSSSSVTTANYMALHGEFNGRLTTETSARMEVNVATTFSDLKIQVLSNSTTASSTLNFRINGANGNQSVSVSAGSTGIFTDAVNTDVVSTVTNEVNYRFANGSAHALSVKNMSVVGAFSISTPSTSVSDMISGTGIIPFQR